MLRLRSHPGQKNCDILFLLCVLLCTKDYNKILNLILTGGYIITIEYVFSTINDANYILQLLLTLKLKIELLL